MAFKIATWNINSVRLRMPIVERLIMEVAPDVLCLQETKCPNDLFPRERFEALGYPHIAMNGQKGYHGVATLSKMPFDDVVTQDYCAVGDARHLSARIAVGQRAIRVHNLYVPAGGDEPDPAINPKFRHKLDFVEEMRSMRASGEPGVSSILVGDLNIAPFPEDVWSHKQLLKVVSHTPVETEGLLRVIAEGGWSDLVRQALPLPEKVYTWWSYRAKDWTAADRGRRLDHVWSSADLSPHLTSVEILRDARGWERPSDHVPIVVSLDI
ncbi:exodeoxyribonuclease-3 [Aureimonas altamirensis DSM 21988]|uniref:Exodeoxyribonuclease-3 n=1 Tax=Aureimonas altamirensis DSM 21988 TaxID=1121026 RepID=A0ABY1IPE2_9HYPH|nr:exodeoxyribonuclease III [Aureimonas altamirensis]SHJ76782.1 exodeoxyribonuclease-3 [Aureimonas altamirensis DSM 21988]